MSVIWVMIKTAKGITRIMNFIKSPKKWSPALLQPKPDQPDRFYTYVIAQLSWYSSVGIRMIPWSIYTVRSV